MKSGSDAILPALYSSFLLRGLLLFVCSCTMEPYTPNPGECIPDNNPTSNTLNVPTTPSVADIFWDGSGSMSLNTTLQNALIDSLDSRVLQNAGVEKIEHFLVGDTLTQVPTANEVRQARSNWSSLHLAASETGRRLALRQIGIAIIVSDLELAIDPALIEKGGDACVGVPMPSTSIAGAIFGRCLTSGFRGASTFPAPILLPGTANTDGQASTGIGIHELSKIDSPESPQPINSLFLASFRTGPGLLKQYSRSSLPAYATDIHVLIISLDPQLGKRVAAEMRAVLPMRNGPTSPADVSAEASFTETLIVDTSLGDLGASRCSWSDLGGGTVSPYAPPKTCTFDCMRQQTSLNLLCTVGEPIQLQPVTAWLPPSTVQLSVSDPERMHLQQPILQSATTSVPASFGIEIGCGVSSMPASSSLGECGNEPGTILTTTLIGGWQTPTSPTEPSLIEKLFSVSNSSNVQQVYQGLIESVKNYLPQRTTSVSVKLCDE